MRRALGALVAAGLSAEALPAAATPEALGFEPTSLGKEDTAKAIGYANAVLGPGSPITLVAGWDPGAVSSADAVVVWLVASPGNPNSALMEVPKNDCRCIVVRIRDVRAWAARGEKVDGEQSLAFDLPYLMTFMLLHEAGHVAAGDPGSLDAGEAGIIGPQERLTTEQCREVRADAFAARAIGTAIQQVGKPGWMEAQWTANELSKLSWDLFGKRLLERFPADALGLPEVFGDPAYTHPNTDLRVYAVNAEIGGDETSKQLLAEFIGKRLEIGRPDLTCDP